MGDRIFDYYLRSRVQQYGGNMVIYKAGWKPHYQQQGGSGPHGFLSSLSSFLKPLASSAAKNVGRAVKSGYCGGKKLMKIGMQSLKDWAIQKQLNEAIQANLRSVAAETADEYADGGPPDPSQGAAAVARQAGSGRRRRKRSMLMPIPPKRRRRYNDIFLK